VSAIAEAAIIWKLKQTSAVTALVGQRIYPRIAPENDRKPYIAVLRPPGQTVDHTNNSPIAVARTPLMIACVGETYEQSRSLSDPIAAALDASGWTGSVFWNDTEIASCFQGGTYDQSTFPQVADEIGFPVEFITFELEHET